MISELVKELRWIADHEYQSRNSEGTIRRAADVIEMLSKKAREPKQGGWIHRSYYRSSTKMYDCEMYVCNKCRYECSHDAETGRSAGSYNYCPNCGARMKGADDD